MKPFDRPDSLYFEAATGWLELGNCTAAFDELTHITADNQSHPDVLELRCKIYERASLFEACLPVAETLSGLRPHSVFPWLCRSLCLEKLKRVPEAYSMLEKAIQDLPAPEILYRLGFLAFRLGDMMQARNWFTRCFESGGKLYRVRALDDPELAQFWKNNWTSCS